MACKRYPFLDLLRLLRSFPRANSTPELSLFLLTAEPVPSGRVLVHSNLFFVAMENTAKGGVTEPKKMEQNGQGEAKDSNDVKGSKGLSDNIIPHILNLYNSTATPRDFEIYAPNATFEDPFMCARGVKQIKSAFYSIPKVFSETKIVDYSIHENASAVGRGEILIDSKQHYKLLGKDIDMISLIKLHIENGKVIRHEDLWDKKPLWNKETVKLPLAGRLAEIMRRGSMLATHAMMGFGKDPTP